MAAVNFNNIRLNYQRPFTGLAAWPFRGAVENLRTVQVTNPNWGFCNTVFTGDLAGQSNNCELVYYNFAAHYDGASVQYTVVWMYKDYLS